MSLAKSLFVVILALGCILALTHGKPQRTDLHRQNLLKRRYSYLYCPTGACANSATTGRTCQRVNVTVPSFGAKAKAQRPLCLCPQGNLTCTSSNVLDLCTGVCTANFCQSKAVLIAGRPYSVKYCWQ
jgi:hypothetical protein